MLCVSELRIIPDWTILIEFAVFLFVLFVLNVLIIKPLLKIMERRKAFTVDASEEAHGLTEEADHLEVGRHEVLTMALREAQSDRDKGIGKALREADGITSAARSWMGKTVSSTEVSIESDERSIVEEMDKRSKELADMIVDRVSD